MSARPHLVLALVFAVGCGRSEPEFSAGDAALSDAPATIAPDSPPPPIPPLVNEPLAEAPAEEELDSEPPPQPEPRKPESRRVGRKIELDCNGRDVRALFIAGRIAGVHHTWRVEHRVMTHHFARYRLTDGVQLSSMLLVAAPATDSPLRLSPDGNRLIYQDTERAVQAVSAVDGLPFLENWKPCPGRGALGRLEWMDFLDNDRFLVINSAEEIILWKLSEERILYRVFLAETTLRENTLGFTLTPDRSGLIVPTRLGFSLYDTATGQLRSQFRPLEDENRIVTRWGAAVSPDGRRLAARIALETGVSQPVNYLVCWDLHTGKLVSRIYSGGYPSLGREFSVRWWGPQRILTFETLHANQRVVDPEGGWLFSCCPTGDGALAWECPDNRLYYTASWKPGEQAFLTWVSYPRSAPKRSASAREVPLRLSPDGFDPELN
jgi:hypothetical protein